MPDPRETPAMQQYYRFKQRHPGCVLLFRIGDFYEMFDDDAVTVSKAIGLTLTQRTAGVPMAGMPFHQLETYLRKLIAAGFRVAVCEQIESAAAAEGNSKAVIARAVTRVLTPGTLVDDALLEDQSLCTLAAVAFPESGDDSFACLAVVDVATGDFQLTECSAPQLVDELARRGVREVLYAATDGPPPPRVSRALDALRLAGTPRPGWQFRVEEGRRELFEHFRVASLRGFGLSDADPALAAAGAIIRYLHETQASAHDNPDAQRLKLPLPSLAHLRPPRRADPLDACVLDAVSLRALEVERTLRSASVEGSLLGLFLGGSGSPSVCRTALGKRQVREWLCRPSRSLATIEARHRVVGGFVEDRRFADEVGAALGDVPDVARIAGRVSLARATPRDLVALARGLAACAPLERLLAGVASLAPMHAELAKLSPTLEPVATRIASTCVDDPPQHFREGGLIRDGIDPELDQARSLERDAGAWLAAYQQRLIEQHDLPSLKVGYNKIFGYFIELPSAQSKRAPAEFTRKQTLKNAERYITPELHTFERDVTTAQARALDRERAIFEDLSGRITACLAAIAAFAAVIGELDALLAFAEHARRAAWTKPAMVESPCLRLVEARHPVLERVLGADFVPNDLELGPSAACEENAPPKAATPGTPAPDAPRGHDGSSLALITGPNMAGKSTFIRTAALITLLAHAGSFVPAGSATIGLTDRIFTRIGADDALHAGQSTFMVEMTETANILNHVSPHSLIILDEIGRGTSTLDGLSLAWGIAEFLADFGAASDDAGDTRSNTSHASPRVLFATHYHELTDLPERFPGRVKNLHVAVREWPADAKAGQNAGEAAGSRIIFLHRILPGRSDQSYGIHVAELAGLPRAVLARAREVLASLSVHHVGDELGTAAAASAPTTNGRLKPAQRADHRTTPDVARIPAKGRAAHEQLALFKEFIPHPAIDRLREIKLDALTPLQAFDELRRLAQLLDEARPT